MDYNIMDFGAVGDGVTLDTHAIQAAIDACTQAGGGRVVFPSSKIFRSGALILGSDLELHLEMGAVLKGSDNLDDYRLQPSKADHKQGNHVPSYVNCEYAGAPSHYFLFAKGCRNLAITGWGKIDGNQEIYFGEVTKWHIEGSFYPRAPLLFIEDTDHFSMRNVTLQNSAFWTVHMVGCRDVMIDGIRILNDLRMANCDGIDPDHCQNVRISNCHIECADDCIVFKNTAAAMQYGPCENITVSNCTLISTSAAIKFGSESEALFRNILIENCAISRTNRGISLQLRDPGSIENVTFHNISIQTRLFKKEMFWGAAEPIAITALKRKPETQVGTIKNICFSNIFCDSENGILLYAQESDGISQIRFDNLSLRLQKRTDHIPGHHDLRPTYEQTETQGLCYVYAHNVKDVSFDRCSFEADPAMSARLLCPVQADCCKNLKV